MLNWLFKKRRSAEAAPAPATTPAPAPPSAPTLQQHRASWQARLAAAEQDDDALLALAREAPLLDVKLAAIEALRHEQSLKAAEREFRRHDRRVHQRVRQRLEATAAIRESRAKADALIEAALALAADPVLPLNRLVQIDREWQALDAAAIEPARTEAFAVARHALDLRVQEREVQRQRERERKAATRSDAETPPAGVPAARSEPESAAPPRAAAVSASEPASVAPPATVPPPAARRRPGAAKREQVESIERLVAAAEAAAEDGQLAPLSACMTELDRALDALGGATLPAALRERRQAVAGAFARLRGWQQWGSARAVDMLVEAAEALAQAVAAPAQAQAADSQTADSPAPPRPPIVLEAHAAAIRDLRARWKVLAHQHAAAGAAQWKRFDGALQAAYAPLAERQSVVDAQRRDNLAARTALLDALDTLAAEPAADAPAAEHWRSLGRALDRFRADWRALGPVEHRVARDARQAINQRLRRSVSRLETPLARARATAAAAREPLIATAEALAQDQAQPLREAAAQARDLQAEWARQSREVPLAHAVENALWTRFRSAIDAIYARRDAAAQAADAERSALVAAREALIARLAAIDGETPTAEARRTLAEIDTAWRDAPDWPRGAGAGLAQRYAQARAAVQALIDDAAGRRWRAMCDTLAERLALCAARESSGGNADDDAWQARWDALGASLLAWDDALARRWAAAGTIAIDPTVIDDALLRLEASLDLPSPPELAPTRRTLKLTALKDTLEGRASAVSEPAQRATWLLTLIGRPCADAAQRERLAALVGALRSMSNDVLRLPLSRE